MRGKVELRSAERGHNIPIVEGDDFDAQAY